MADELEFKKKIEKELIKEVCGLISSHHLAGKAWEDGCTDGYSVEYALLAQEIVQKIRIKLFPPSASRKEDTSTLAPKVILLKPPPLSICPICMGEGKYGGLLNAEKGYVAGGFICPCTFDEKVRYRILHHPETW